MKDRIEYRCRPEDGRRNGYHLEIVTTKKIADYVTAAHGPMLDQIREPETRRVVTREYHGDGELSLIFGRPSSRGWTGTPVDRAADIMGVVAQIDAVAKREGWSDPRLQLLSEETDATEGFFPLVEPILSFERPAGGDEELVAKIHRGLVLAAKPLPYDRGFSSTNSGITRADIDAERGLRITIGESNTRHIFKEGVRPGSESDARIELHGEPVASHDRYAAHARILAITGIVSALDPLQ